VLTRLWIALLLVSSGCPGGSRSFPDGPGLDHLVVDILRPDAAMDHGAGVQDMGVPCTAGETATRSCGACSSGTQTRTCDGSGAWGPWGVCSDERTDFPTDPTIHQPVCPPYTWPAVFFTPHPDDETLAMAGAIKEHLAAGRSVFVELLTHGEASAVRTILQDGGTCSWHSGTHNHVLTPAQFGQARVTEFLDAMSTLGVKGVHVSDLGDGNLTVAEVASRIGFWEKHKPAPGVSYKGTLGTTQSDAGGATHPDHIATWTALTTSGLADVRGYNASLYTPITGKPLNTVHLDASTCAAKTAALAVYMVWNPSAARYAVGYHSVKATFDSVAASCEEYVLYLTP